MLSFIIPVFNDERYLHDCVTSILAIKYEKEIIIIDDGSTDSSFLLGLDISYANPEVKIFRKNNGGAATARNYGIEHSNGEYIIFVDADDTVLQE